MARFVNNFNYKDGISYFQHAQYNAYFNNQTNQLVKASRKDAQKLLRQTCLAVILLVNLFLITHWL